MKASLDLTEKAPLQSSMMGQMELIDSSLYERRSNPVHGARLI